MGIHGEDSKWWHNLTDEEFQTTFRLSRKTLTELQAEIDYMESVNQDRIENVLLACLWLLGNVNPLDEAARLFGLDNPEQAIQEYLEKLLKLASMYMLWPSVEEAAAIENCYLSLYGFPNVIGVIGSLHIEVNVGNIHNKRYYYNKVMQKYTIVLQAVCDHNLLLRNVCVGYPGAKGIKKILQSSPLYDLLTNSDSILVTNGYHLLGGTEHPQLDTLLTPYRFETIAKPSESQIKYNASHSTAMSSVENTFRCMENRFPRLTSVEDLNSELAVLVVSSICVLHNFTHIRNDHCDLYHSS